MFSRKIKCFLGIISVSISFLLLNNIIKHKIRRNIMKTKLFSKAKLLTTLYTLILGIATFAANSPSQYNKFDPERPKKLKRLK